MPKLVVVVTCVDAPETVAECLHWLDVNTSDQTTVMLLDNGSKVPLAQGPADRLVRFHENIGGNAVFHAMLPHLDAEGADLVAYLHCDMMVRELNWDLRVIQAFVDDPILALCGFVGSSEVDERGGRGAGTALNFLGASYPNYGPSSPTHHHGRSMSGIMPAAVLDHCSMIFRISVLRQLPTQEQHYAPGHFYDRICCAECIHQGYHVAVIGIQCDHLSGGIGAGMESQLALYRKWLTSQGLPWEPGHEDRAVYIESERRFFARFRDELKLIPYGVNADYSVIHFVREFGRWVQRPYIFGACRDTII